MGQGSGSSKSACGLKAVQLDGTANGAIGVALDEWTFVGRVGVPIVDEVGPGVLNGPGGFATCFARTPMGAVFSGVWMIASGIDPSIDQVAWVEYSYSESQLKAEMIERTREAMADIDWSGVKAPEVSIWGYRLLDYDGDIAWVDIAVQLMTKNGQRAHASWSHRLVWENGDWRLDASFPGDQMTSIQIIASPQGYWHIGINDHG